MTLSQVRTRIAPSPTGDPHIGTAYMSLFDRTFAHKHGGKFILRIEDTDQVRYNPESVGEIIESLNWLGLMPDEGPGIGGDYGPYVQTQRSDLYIEHANKLVETSHAYRFFCTKERLDQMRKEQAARHEPPPYPSCATRTTPKSPSARTTPRSSGIASRAFCPRL